MPNITAKVPRKTSSKKDKSSRHLRNQIAGVISILLIIFGLLILGKYVSMRSPISNPSFVTVKTNFGSMLFGTNSKNINKNTNPPIRIIIPKTNIDINVVEAPLKDGYWETSDTNASHGIGSANPGEVGNAVIFAHARPGLFYDLKNVKKNDIVYVLTNKDWHAYSVTSIKSVFPNQTEVISPTDDQTLTLYTCTGYDDEKRLIVVAKPIKTVDK